MSCQPREDSSPFADTFVKDGKGVARDLKNAERPPQQCVLERQHADVGELSRLDRTTQFHLLRVARCQEDERAGDSKASEAALEEVEC